MLETSGAESSTQRLDPGYDQITGLKPYSAGGVGSHVIPGGRTTRAGAVVVPSSAVQPGQAGPYVYVVKPDSTVESRTVRSTDYPGSLVVIESGLAAGERVVVDGQLRLAPGALVVSKPAPGETPAPAPTPGAPTRAEGGRS